MTSQALHLVVDALVYQLQSHGGITRLYNELLPRLCDMDPEARVDLLSRGWERQPLPVHPRIAVRGVPKIELLLRPGRLWRPVVEPIKRCIMHRMASNAGGNTWLSTYYTFIPRWHGRQVVMVYDMIHELMPDLAGDRYGNQIRMRKRACLAAADAVICISETTKQDVLRFYSLAADRVYVAYPGLPASFSSSVGPDLLPDEDFAGQAFILYIGTRQPYKGFTCLLEAYSHWDKRDRVLLAVVGTDWSDAEAASLRSLGVEDKVRLLGYISDARLARCYAHALAFVYPSLYEGFGLPLLEAMAARCPIVASRIPSTIEVGRDIPYYFEPGNVGSLLVALDAAWSRQDQPTRLDKGIALAESYTWQRMARQVLAALTYHAKPL